MADRCASIVSFLLLLSFALQQAQGLLNKFPAGGTQMKQSNRRPSTSPEEVYVPVNTVVYRTSSSMLPPASATEAMYEPFELCQGCRCCSSSNASSCLDTSCCYAINCDIPGKPFGTCAFTPHTCGCSTENCTQPS